MAKFANVARTSHWTPRCCEQFSAQMGCSRSELLQCRFLNTSKNTGIHIRMQPSTLGNHIIHVTYGTRHHLITVYIQLQKRNTRTSTLLPGAPTPRLDGMLCANSVQPKDITLFHMPLVINTLLTSFKDVSLITHRGVLQIWAKCYVFRNAAYTIM
jgi:hypothetical protein